MTMEKPGGGAAQQTPEEVKKPQEGFQEPPAEPEGEAGKAASGQDAAQEGLGVQCPPAEPEGEAGGAASGEDAAAGQPPQQAEAAPEEETDAYEEEEEDEDEEDEEEDDRFTTPVLFTLRFPISLEDFKEFHRLMSGGVFKQQQRRSFIWGGMEVAISALYLILSFTGIFEPMSTFQWVLVAVLLAVGLFSLYNGVFYKKRMEKVLERQYEQSSFRGVQLVMKFHEDGVEEVTGDSHLVTKFSKIYQIVTTSRLYMIQVDPRRSVLIPRATLGKQDAQLADLLTRASERYEKRRVNL